MALALVPQNKRLADTHQDIVINRHSAAAIDHYKTPRGSRSYAIVGASFVDSYYSNTKRQLQEPQLKHSTG